MKKGIMLSCEDTTFLVVKKDQEKLGMWDRMRIFMHLSMCKYCSLFAKQNKFIDENRESIGKGTDEDCGPPHVWISNVFSMKNYK